MQRSIARRFAPLAAVVAVQLLIITIAPSRTNPTEEAAFTPGRSDVASTDPVTGEPLVRGATPDQADGGGAVSAPDSQGGANAGGTTGADAAATGNTAHCVGDRQFDPAIYRIACLRLGAGRRRPG